MRSEIFIRSSTLLSSSSSSSLLLLAQSNCFITYVHAITLSSNPNQIWRKENSAQKRDKLVERPPCCIVCPAFVLHKTYSPFSIRLFSVLRSTILRSPFDYCLFSVRLFSVLRSPFDYSPFSIRLFSVRWNSTTAAAKLPASFSFLDRARKKSVPKNFIFHYFKLHIL